MRLVLIDTCGARASLALAMDDILVAEDMLAERAASPHLLAAMEGLLQRAGWSLEEIEAVGVVNGPGSFTGVRVGLSVAKALCEALALPMAAVSRLEVLWEAGVQAAAGSLVALDAGRGELFVRDAKGLEVVLPLDRIDEMMPLTLCEERLAARLPHAQRVELTAAQALAAVSRCLRRGGSDVAMTDANYVRGEADLYAAKRPS